MWHKIYLHARVTEIFVVCLRMNPKVGGCRGQSALPVTGTLWFSLIAPFYVPSVLKHIFRKDLFKRRHKIKSMLRLSITNDFWTPFCAIRLSVEFSYKVKNKLSACLKENSSDKRNHYKAAHGIV